MMECGEGFSVLRLTLDQPSLWESILPSGLFQVNKELADVDSLLDDERFLASFRARFYTKVGRPSASAATCNTEEE